MRVIRNLPSFSGLFVALVVSLSLGITNAQSMPQSSELSDVDLEKLRIGEPEWFGVYAGAEKAGYCKMGFEKRKKDGQEIIVSVSTMLLQLDQESKMEMVEVAEFESKPPYRMIGGWAKQAGDLGDLNCNCVVKSGKLIATIKEAGIERTHVVEDFKFDLAKWAALEMQDFSKLKEGDVLRYRTFDLSELVFDNEHHEVKKIRNTKVNGVPVRFIETHHTSEQIGGPQTCRFSENGKMISMKAAGILELRAERKSVATDFSHAADLFVLGNIRVNKAIGEPEDVEALELKIKKEFADAIFVGPYQSVEERDGKQILLLGKKYGKKALASKDEIEKHLKPTALIPVKHPTIQALTKKAIGDETDPEQKVRKLITFVSDYIEDSYEKNALSVLDVCKNKAGDCSEHSMLFTTMARAAGIPCREVGGFIYAGDDTKAFAGHAWNEVVLDGCWVPVDSTWDEFEINATHIQFKKESEPKLFSFRMRMRLLKKEMKSR